MLTLIYDNNEIGKIENDKGDFPTMTGILTLNENWRELLDRPALNFVRLGFGETDEEKLSSEEFDELMYWVEFTEKWKIKNSKGDIYEIPPPTFRPEYIAWRW